ncbi:MAG TPA: hypothetical protein VIJ77_08525, partial [Candidatus Tumulicola sp.]
MGEITQTAGPGEKVSHYEIADSEMAAGSTLGAPKATMIVKATGAIEKFYSSDIGKEMFGTVLLNHWDARTGIALSAQPGVFRVHPEHQEHVFRLSNGLRIHEKLFVLSGKPERKKVDPPAGYYDIEIFNDTLETKEIDTYAFAQLRGNTTTNISTSYSESHRAIVAWNEGGDLVRVFGASIEPTSYEVTSDQGKVVATRSPGVLCGETMDAQENPLGALHFSHRLKPNEYVRFHITLCFSNRGRSSAVRLYGKCPSAIDALERTRRYYHEILSRAVVVCPDPDVNRGVLWAKANMLRTQLLADTGWCAVNDPTRSNNSVGRDTAWFAFGADYITPEFSRDSLLWYAEHLEKRGMVVEYYDIRTGESEDYGLNINDNTPLLILALWHHFGTTGDRTFLKRVYPHAVKAARYILSQRDERGLVWCTASGTSDWGIIGWRNVIKNYHLAGATTEVNAECYAALQKVSSMARVLGNHDESAAFKDAAGALREAINTHLLDPETKLYYLNIARDGTKRTDCTSDMVFPVMFGVADEDVAARIVARLSAEEFWTSAGIRTVPRTAIDYGPTHGYGLLGGVWVGVSFWYAFAAARFNAAFMAHSLGASFRHYSSDPRRNNTVPGQFSEWLHGETLANEGMMLSPWFPPRYLWAAIEGAAGLDLSEETPRIKPCLAPDWQWIGVQNLPFHDRTLTWFAAETPELQVYGNFRFEGSAPTFVYDDDITSSAHAVGDYASCIALRKKDAIAILVGNATDRTIATAMRLSLPLQGGYALRTFNSLRREWVDEGEVTAAELQRGLALQLDRKGFCVL